MRIQDSRQLIKRSSTAGLEPTIPTGSTIHTDGTWNVEDIYAGELFLNMEDKYLWFGWEDISGNTGVTLVNPFGNLTGSCIDELFVSNIYGCSPITIHDSIQYPSCSATGLESVALGNGNLSSGDFSLAQGEGTESLGISSHAQGLSTLASGNYSHAEGRLTSAVGLGSHAEGNTETSSVGDYSHAEGSGCISNGNSSHAEGTATTSNGLSSHSEGRFTIAEGDYSHAEGETTLSSGFGSHAEGQLTESLGDYSHTQGRHTIANGDYQCVIGKFNVTGTTEAAFIIGNGANDSSRSNLFVAVGNDIDIIGDVNITGDCTATNFIGDGSLLTNLPTPSLGIKSNTVAGASFSGSPLTYTVVFASAYPNTNYSITITGEVNRTFTWETKTVNGFIINANSATAFTEDVDWITKSHGEF